MKHAQSAGGVSLDERSPAYEVLDYPRSRLATVDVGRFNRNKHYMFGLLEVDVTEVRRALRSLRRDGGDTSFTAWVIKAIGESVARNRGAQAMRWKRRSLVAFHDVDIAVPIERIVADQAVPLVVLIRGVNRKSAQEIQREIDAARRKPIVTEKDFVLSGHGISRRALQLYYAAPQVVRLLLWHMLLANPFRGRNYSGTVMVTTVNAGDGASGWILPTRTMHNLAISLGSVTRKPWVVHGRVEIRDILNLTVTFNHDVIDGVPARRFVQDLVRSLENQKLS